MERADRWLSFSLRAALLALFLWTIKGLLAPVVLGGIFGVLLFPLARRLERRLGRLRGYAPGVVTGLAVVVFILPQALIVSQLVTTTNELLARDWSGVLDRLQAVLSDRMAWLSGTLGVSVARARAFLSDGLGRLGTGAAGMAGELAKELPIILIDIFLFVVSLYFFLRDGDALSRWMKRLSPFPPEDTEVLFLSIRDTVNGAVLGIVATALVQGTLTTLALSLLRVPGALLFGVLAMLLSLVPLVGTTPVTLGATLYLLLIGRTGAAIAMLAAAVVIGLSDNVVRPWVQSSQGRMHPLLALLSILGGLQLLGVPGIFIGPVITAMALWAIDTYATLRMQPGEPPPPSETA